MTYKKRFSLTFILFFVVFGVLKLQAQTILIDPGHGGKDDGAKAFQAFVNKKGKLEKKTHFEKDLVLELSKRISKKLKEKNYRVFMTRSFDRTVSLEKRAEIAERVNADLFISIHANASYYKTSGGFETYYLNNKSNQAIKKVEEVENKGLEGEDSVVNQILIDLVVNRTVESSKALASSIHGKLQGFLGTSLKMKDRGIKPGLFFVLALSKRPGVLLEMGFMSNPKELRKISSSVFQERYSDAVVFGIEKYFSKTRKKL
ncbi:MAG: N-acetylmuramoyl-L-alanine amidase [Bdellovibrionota bacterium]|nr:N-acetylmuramoyl-L-alanine amidase [Bdellovibrionota bacterium]